MKKLLLLGLVLAILILAMPQGVSAANDQGTATVSAKIEDSITLAVTDPALWTLNFGVDECSGTANCNQADGAISGTVNSNDDWTLTSQADADGYMRSSTNVPLGNRLLIQVETGEYGELTSAHQLASGTGLTPYQTFSRNLRQVLAITDRSDIGNYGIVITLDATSAA
jgi:hypothetical protein